MEKIMEVKISKGNVKMGAIPSVSNVPVVCCHHCAACKKDCYARRMMRYSSVKNAYYNNLEMFKNEPENYFEQISYFCKMQRFFRWHVAGDIINFDYLLGMVKVAVENPHCKFLAFTKYYEVVNEFLSGQELPENLQIIFSNWGDFKCENPHNLPCTDVIEPGAEVPEGCKLCGGNCFECCCRGVGCWELKKGEKLVFYKH